MAGRAGSGHGPERLVGLRSGHTQGLRQAAGLPLRLLQAAWTGLREGLADPDGVVVIDPSAFPKKGAESCGVARQWCGRLGQLDDGQVGVFLAYATKAGYAPLGRRLYLPEDRADDAASRETYDEPTEARLYPSSWAPAQFQGLGDGVVVRNWVICGPFGGPGAEAFREDLGGDQKDLGRKCSDAATYPPDSGEVDLHAAFSGPAVQGYWRDPGVVRWHPATVADLDTRVAFGPSAQVWYASTWIHAPAEPPLEFRFQGHPQTYLRFALNGKTVQDGESLGESSVRESRKALTLAKGWNQVSLRGFCVGYPPFQAGLILAGPPEALWPLRLSATPPE